VQHDVAEFLAYLGADDASALMHSAVHEHPGDPLFAGFRSIEAVEQDVTIEKVVSAHLFHLG
jgi:hypothetical protein